MFSLSSVCLQVCTGVCRHGVGARRRCARRIVRATRRVSTRAKRGFQPAVGVPRLVGASSTPAAPPQQGGPVPSHRPVRSAGVGARLRGHPGALAASGGGAGGMLLPPSKATRWEREWWAGLGARGGDHGAGGRAASTQRLAGSGAGLWCTDGRVIKNNKRKETWIRYSLSTLIVLWGPNHNRVLLEGIQKRNQMSRSVQS